MPKANGMNNDKLLTRIGNLLRQAEGTDNAAEAEAFTEAAQRLATTHSVSLELARATAGSRDKAISPIQRRCGIGERGKKGLRTYVALMLAIAKNNNVKIDIATNSTFVVQYGFESDIDTVDALYSSLVVQMVKACEAFLQSGEWRNTRIQRQVTRRGAYGSYTDWEERVPTQLQARLEFQTGYAHKIGERLAAGRAQATADIDAANAVDATCTDKRSAELVLRGKDVAVADHYKATSKARGSYRGNRRGKTYGAAARQAGADAAAQARLSGQNSIGGSRRKLSA